MSSSVWSRKVDVFLSFSCAESIIRHLDYMLSRKGLETYTSYRCLETSVIPINLQTQEEAMALKEAKVAVVMISSMKPYTVGFLEELRLILNFQAKGSLKVIPIWEEIEEQPFYEVGEEVCRQYPGNVLIWRNALQKLANIAAGYPFSDMSQHDCFQKIVDDIHCHFVCPTSNDLNCLVAMDRHMKVVYDLLASEVNEEVRIIGIWGSAGVGKTTLARYIYADISLKFQTHVFLENVENIKNKILEFQGEEDPSVIRSLDSNGHEIIEARHKHCKVLLIADDVNNFEQGKWIIEYTKWFAPGSRVILISENENLFVDAGVKHVYEVRSLRYDEALQLFSHFAFGKPYPPSDFEKLSVHAVHLAGFLPLALRLLGSILTGKGRQEWSDALKELGAKKSGIMEVWNIMETVGDTRQVFEKYKRQVAAYILEKQE